MYLTKQEFIKAVEHIACTVEGCEVQTLDGYKKEKTFTSGGKKYLL